MLDTQSANFEEQNISFAFGFKGPFTKIHGEFTIAIENYIAGVLLSSTPIEVEPCKMDYPGLKVVEKEMPGEKTLFCPKSTTNLTLTANHLQKEKSY